MIALKKFQQPRVYPRKEKGFYYIKGGGHDFTKFEVESLIEEMHSLIDHVSYLSKRANEIFCRCGYADRSIYTQNFIHNELMNPLISLLYEIDEIEGGRQ